MNSKGQITLFMIIGIIVLTVAGVVFYLNRPVTEEIVGVMQAPLELRPVQTHVEDCIRDIAVPGLYLLGVQGGYVHLPMNYVSTPYSDIAYGYFDGRGVLPSIEEMEFQLMRYMEEAVPLCVDFSLFPNINISDGHITSEVTINPNDVVFRINYPIKARKEGTVREISEFRAVVPIKLSHIHDIMSGILGKTLEDPDWVDLSYLSEFDVSVEVIPHDEDTIIYSITEEKEASPYVFLSAFKFKKNSAPIIDIEDIIYLEDGLPFIREVNVTDPDGDDFVCADDSALFDISEDCVILFNPEVPGAYDVTIGASDVRGNYAQTVVRFEVVERK